MRSATERSLSASKRPGMSDADWEPLSPAQLCRNPGELVDLGKCAVPSVALPVPMASPAVPAAPVVDPVAAAALLALQQQLAASQPGSSWVAQSLQRERRAQHKRASVGKTAELAATLVQAAPPTAPVPEIEYAPGADGRDPREEQDWFVALPAAERDRLHAAWAQKRQQEVSATVVQRRNRNRRFFASIACFAMTLVLGTGALWHATAGAAIVCGIWWRHAGADRFLDPVRALACFGGLQCLAMVVAQRVNQQLFMDAILLTSFAAIVGFEGEIRRSGGFDAH